MLTVGEQVHLKTLKENILPEKEHENKTEGRRSLGTPRRNGNRKRQDCLKREANKNKNFVIRTF